MARLPDSDCGDGLHSDDHPHDPLECNAAGWDNPTDGPGRDRARSSVLNFRAVALAQRRNYLLRIVDDPTVEDV